MSDRDRQADAAAHGIGAVARLTGLSDHTIRAWERRYGAVVARRAANGRRVYTEGDIAHSGWQRFTGFAGVLEGYCFRGAARVVLVLPGSRLGGRED